MIYLWNPAPERIWEDISRLSEAAISNYPEVGATGSASELNSLPSHYNIDRYHVTLGHGGETFERAKRGMHEWRGFAVPGVRVFPSGPIEPETVVGIMVDVVRIHWLNLCRVVYVVSEEGRIERFGFAYGTLGGHAEQGEERFELIWNHDSEEVTYSITSFSRAHHILARIGKPFARRMQRRFGHDSMAALRSFVVDGTSD